AEAIVDLAAVDEPAAEVVVEEISPKVEEPRGRRGRRFGRRRDPEPEAVPEAVADEEVEEDAARDEPVLEAPAIDEVFEDVIVDVAAVDEAVVYESVVDEIVRVVEERRARRGRRVGLRHAPEPEVARTEIAGEAVVEDAALDELVLEAPASADVVQESIFEET